MHRASFVMGWAAAFLGARAIASADNGVSAVSADSKASPKPHVHGPNGVTSLPEHRPIAWKMDVLDGPPFDLSAYRGKVVFINIFATWCGPCNNEQPAVVRFAEKHPDDTVVVGMNYEEYDDRVRAYRKKFGIPYPIAMDRQGKVLRGVYAGRDMGFPMTIVFRADGTLSCAWEGDANLAWFESERDAALAHPSA
jgi:thiol-disulfide isomerase/thioredoxin